MSSQPNPYSSSVPALSSGFSMPPMPPPPQAATRRPEDPAKKAPLAKAISSGSGMKTLPDPPIISNQDIFVLLKQVKEQLRRQDASHQTLMKEVEILKAARENLAEQTPTPLMPRTLNFDASDSSRANQSGFTATQPRAGIQDPLRPSRVVADRDLGSIPRSLSRTPNVGNIPNNLSYDDELGAQDPGISPVMAKELKKLKDMISSVPGVVQPIPEVAPASHRVSRFAPPICDAEIPKRFQTPSMKQYDGTTDPEEHIAQYRERMEIIPIPADLKEACLCKGFGATLTGSALKWLLSVPPYSITSFSDLVNRFNNQFSCSRTFERLTNDLYRVIQNSNESLRDYVSRFGREALNIPNIDVTTAVQAFKMGLRRDSPFYEDIVMNPCRNLDEVRNRALRYIRLEEDKIIQRRIETPSTYDRPNRKTEASSAKYYKSKPYSRSDDYRVNAVEGEDDDECYPKLTDYCFSVDISGIMCAMQNLGEKARWPKKNDRNPGWKDKSKWCAFHEDFGHITEDCIALRKEISYLLGKGHLKELFGKKKNQTQDLERPQDPEKVTQRARSPPPDAKIINFISGGSDICGTSYSAAKRYAKESKLNKETRPTKNSTLTADRIVSFEEEDRDDIQDPHHDGLVVTLYVANHFVRRILVDGGSSVNIIRLETLKKMNIPESEIVSRSIVLVGFSGETKDTIGEIKLPVYIEGVNSLQKFSVIDSLSCYNIILGRPWIHDMKAVPSTYHQCVKLPTPWGVVKVNSDQQEAKDCYTTSMKPTTKPNQA